MTRHFHMKLSKYSDFKFFPLLNLVILTGYFICRIEVGKPFPILVADNQVIDELPPLEIELFWIDLPMGKSWNFLE